MKKQISMVLAMLVIAFSTAFAQPQKSEKHRKAMNAEKMEEFQLNAILQKLALDDKEREQFIPLYKQYQQEMKSTNKKCAAMSKRKTERTDAETEEVIKHQFAMAKQKVEIREKYYAKFRKFLSPKQIEKIYDSERNVMKRLQSEKRKRTNQKPVR